MKLPRRKFLHLAARAAALLVASAGASLLVALAGRAQDATPVIGFLLAGTPATTREYVAAAMRSLAEAGYVEGRNLRVERRWGEDHLDRLPALADDLVRRPVAVIITGSTSTTIAAKAATNAIPIVFESGVDPVDAGFIASLNRPGGNLTGVFTLNVTLTAKRLELLHEFAPAATSIAFLATPGNPVYAEAETKEFLVAARTLGVRPLILNVSIESDLDAAFSMLLREHAGGLVVSGESFVFRRANQLIALAARHRVPVIFTDRPHAAAGGLMSYGTDTLESFRLMGVYASRILKGERPADLPVQKISKLRLVLNMSTAKALGLTFPNSLLVRADEVIE